MWSKPLSSGVSSCAHPHSVHCCVPGLSATSRARYTSSSGAPSGVSSHASSEEGVTVPTASSRRAAPF